MKKTYEEIKQIIWIYDQYKTKVEQVEKFVTMSIEQKNFVEEAEREILGKNSVIDNYVENVKAMSNSVVLYNAVIISVYGSFELYIDELLKTYIEYLKTRNLSFKNFPPSLQEKQKNKAAEFIGNPGHFSNYGLSIERVISDLLETIINDNSQAVTDKLLISHGGNMKTTQLNTLFSEFGVSNLSVKLKKHKELQRFSRENGLEGEIIKPEGFPLLDTIVEERNKVAHGWNIDDRIAFTLLLQKYLPFFRVFCKALNDIIISNIIRDGQTDGKILPFDPIIKVWEKGNIIGINNKDFQLHVGDVLFYSTPDEWCYWFEIKSLMHGKAQRNSIRAKNKNITIGCDARIHENYKIWGEQCEI